MVNKCVLSLPLKFSMLWMILSPYGRLFQILGHIDVILDFWTCNRLHLTTGNFNCKLDLHVLAWFLMTMSWRYFGADLLMHLNIRTAILYVILSSIFNQCRLLKYVVMCNTYLLCTCYELQHFGFFEVWQCYIWLNPTSGHCSSLVSKWPVLGWVFWSCPCQWCTLFWQFF